MVKLKKKSLSRGSFRTHGRVISYKNFFIFGLSTLAPSFLIGSSSFLQVMRTTIKAWMSSKFGGIPPQTSE